MIKTVNVISPTETPTADTRAMTLSLPAKEEIENYTELYTGIH